MIKPIPESDVLEISENLKELNSCFEDKTILLAGYAGFLGRVFSSYFQFLNKHVLRYPCKVLALDNYIVGQTPNIVEDENFTIFNHDVCLPLWTKISPDQPIDFIINLSGIADPHAYQKFPLAVMAIGYEGSNNLLSLGYQKKSNCLFMSSSEVYGDPPDNEIPTKEEYRGNLSSTGERACYDESKRCLETLSDIFFRVYGVNVKVIRPFNCFGAGMNLNDKRVLPSFIKSAVSNKPLKVYGSGEETRTFCYSTDFITGALLVLLKGQKGEVYNVGNPFNTISMIDLAKLITKTLNLNMDVEKINPPNVYKEQPRKRCPNIEKVSKLGYFPKVTLEDSIKRYFNWASVL